MSEEPIGNENVDSGGLPNSSEKEDSVNHSEETIVEESSGDKEEATESAEVAESKSEPEAKTDESIVSGNLNRLLLKNRPPIIILWKIHLICPTLR